MKNLMNITDLAVEEIDELVAVADIRPEKAEELARKYPDFFMKMIEDICEDDKAKEVMHLRYIYKMKFKAIPQHVGTEERNVYNLHSKIIHKIITL